MRDHTQRWRVERYMDFYYFRIIETHYLPLFVLMQTSNDPAFDLIYPFISHVIYNRVSRENAAT